MALKPKPCAHCGTPFRGSDKKQRFCSQDCVTLSKGMRLSRRSCVRCGKPYRACHSKQKYCSPQCSAAAHFGPANASYKGHPPIIQSGGYRLIWVSGQYLLEHRHVMEQHLGRPLARNEHVHHRDGKKTNNSIANLEIMTARDHTLIHCPSFRSETHKQCSRCREIKPRSEFYERRSRPGGGDPHRCECKACSAIENAASTERRKARVRSSP